MPYLSVCPCKFSVVCSWTNPHDKLYLVGSIPLLGSWQPFAGIRLRTSDSAYPSWVCQVFLPCEVEIEYKFVVIRGTEAIWERTANRLLKLKSDSNSRCCINDGTFGDANRVNISEPLPGTSPRDSPQRSPRSLRRGIASGFQTLTLGSSSLGASATIAEDSESALPNIFVIDCDLPYKCSKGSDGSWFLTPREYTVSSRIACLREPYEGHSPFVVKYIGLPGFYVPDEDQASLAAALKQVDCFPVFLQSEAQGVAYKKYIASVFLPTFASVHAGGVTATDNEASSKLWKDYVDVNKLFASVFSANCSKSASFAWVLGYELLLVPQHIRQFTKYEKSADIKIIFWLLQPYPTSETFSSLQQRVPLLQSILAADLVGFDLFDYCRHFLHCCRRLLNAAYVNIEGGFLGVSYDNRTVFVRSSPSGVLGSQLNQALRSEEFQKHRASFLELTKDCQCVLVSYDSYDRLAGILLKLMAWDKFLDEQTKHRATYKLVQFCIEPREALPGHDAYKTQMQSLIDVIQKKHPNSVVLFQEDSHISFARKLALFSVGDVFVNSYVRQGVDPTPLEYILANHYVKDPKHPENPAKPATVIISEFTSYSRLLSRAERINPWDTKTFVDAFDKAVNMPVATRLLNHTKFMENIQSIDFVKWARSVVMDTIESVGHDKANYPSASLLTPRLVSSATVNSITGAFYASRSRFIAVVWDRFFNSKFAREIAESLIHLAREASNIVCILYSGSRAELDSHFPASDVTALCIFCEFGAQEKARGSMDRWTSLVLPASQDVAWKAQVMRIMNLYYSRTDGSLPPRATECSLTWDYSHVDPELGAIQVFVGPSCTPLAAFVP